MKNYIVKTWIESNGYVDGKIAYGTAQEFSTFNRLRDELLNNKNYSYSSSKKVDVFYNDEIVFNSYDVYSCYENFGSRFTLEQLRTMHAENAV